ncbi:unnamed protein product, partial [Pylaiella littoralis]
MRNDEAARMIGCSSRNSGHGRGGGPAFRSTAKAVRSAALLVLPLLLFAPATCSLESDGVGPSLEGEVSESNRRACTVEDLMPPDDVDGDGYDYEDIHGQWSGGNDSVVTPPFDCTCSTLKASYFCPNLGTDGYPVWNPRAVSSGECSVRGRSALADEPFPPGFKVLFYGNSHLRQVLESIVCAHAPAIRNRWVTISVSATERTTVLVDADRPCRGCFTTVSKMGKLLSRNECVSSDEVEEACWCDDNESTFEFSNGAILQYHFSHKEENKRIEDAVEIHGSELSEYDAVVANVGNKPRMEVSEMLRTAGVLKEVGVPLFWMSNYDGNGDVASWTSEEQTEFWNSGARYLPVHRMVESLDYLTKGVVEGETYNPHFCMPGPPNEIGILILRIAWSLHDESRARRRRRKGRRKKRRRKMKEKKEEKSGGEYADGEDDEGRGG